MAREILRRRHLREIAPEITFRQWCNQLAEAGLKVDGHPFTLDNRPALHFIYDLIPTTIEEARNRTIVLMKGAQMGLTIWEILADLYMAIKFEPCRIGMYLPDSRLAPYKSSERFMPIVRTVPAAYERLVTDDGQKGRKRSEGNVLTRVMGDSSFLFLWTSGKVFTESFPLDVVSFDEVQEMLVPDMEKVMERMSASRIRLTLMLSTAKWPDADIHYWYQQGSQYQFHTQCGCPGGVILDEIFPQCIQYDNSQDDYVYKCPSCEEVIPDPQIGEWIPKVPGTRIISCHLPQILSATVSAREVIEAFHNAQDLQNFYNRKLGKPWADPSQIPVNLEILNRCVEDGLAAGVTWQSKASGTYMGIDQMGAFNVVIIKKRLPDGRQAVIHVEAIYSDDPFARCDELMVDYGVAVCVVETLPNYNDAKRFAARHRGRVFLAGYADISDNMLRWGDAETKTDRKTDREERDRYTVTLDQYKCMQVSMNRFIKRLCLFPDPGGLHQDIKEKGVTKRVALLKDMVFLHYTKTALVVEKDEEQHKFRRKVVKVGIDPHFSYANMLCDVAWARAHGTTQFLIPGVTQDPANEPSDRQQTVQQSMPGLPDRVVQMIDDLPPGTCGRCTSFDPDRKFCNERQFAVRAKDPGCPLFMERG